jgi:predicted nucleic acid-binding protein
MLIDASVALKLFLEEDDSSAAQLLLEQAALEAPELILAEVANGLWKAHRRGTLSAELYARDVATLVEIFETFHPMAPLTARAAEIAMRLDHPAYDCIYLACAERVESPLVTADRRLLQAVSGSHWATLCRSLSDIG